MKALFHKVTLATIAIDCHLKDWKLKKVMKYFHFTTECVPSVVVYNAIKGLSKDKVVLKAKAGVY
jgi:hypothetical protein